ncbi:MAG TPA: IS4 family transposase, partial [Synechococcales cyanobacterium M55_K2018_004]|nr:IS4 family transposase [Synechococcales cyanobacterium M55_K2018_004]
MTSTTMLSGHVAATLERAQASPGDYLIAAQDTTYYNYSGHGQMRGLGTIQGDVRGVMQHNVLLLNESGLPLGILDQQYWTRQGAKDWPTDEKESQKWLNGLSAINRQASGTNKHWVSVSDRESDIFCFFKAAREPNVDLLVRVCQPRRVEVLPVGVVCSLPSIVSHLNEYGIYRVRIARRHREVELTLSLRAAAVNIYPDKDLSAAKHKTLGLSLVVATEVACIDVKTQADCFEANEAVTWFLLTSLPISTTDEVQRIVHFYSLRWRIERLHFTLKSGALNVERLQFDDIHTLTNALAFYSVVAWQLLALTYALRDDPEQAAEALFEPTKIWVLQQVSGQPIHSVRDAALALARLVGFAPSKKQPLPGVKVLVTAIERFFFIKWELTPVQNPYKISPGRGAGGEGLWDVPRFSKIARSYLLHIGNLDWKQINPDIFGSMIQAIAEDGERGALGMHYTSVPNILKVLNPLFLDDLRAQLAAAGDNPRKLLNLRQRLARIRVFDPACGSGNFLVIAYKEMRAIEAEINRRRGEADRRSEIPLTNFRGIEIRHFACEIARLALIIAEYQCDVLYRGQRLALAEFLPLKNENWITCGNALRLDWL